MVAAPGIRFKAKSARRTAAASPPFADLPLSAILRRNHPDTEDRSQAADFPGMDPFIRYYDGALDAGLCRDIVERFDRDRGRMTGQVSGNEGLELDLTGKQTTELLLDEAGWSDVIEALQRNLSQYLGRYQSDVKFLAGSDHKELFIEPFRIKKYDIGGQFNWHIDCNSRQNRTRCLAVQWYFNTVDKGGRTEFEDQRVKIKPVEGRLAFFPVAWTYRHRGAPPRSGPKYVCTTFVHPRF